MTTNEADLINLTGTEIKSDDSMIKLNAVDAQAFENMRNALYRLAFSILNSELDADRAVRRTLVKWLYANRQDIKSPASWLYDKCVLQSLAIFMSRQRSTCGDYNEKLGFPGDRNHGEIDANPRTPTRNWLSRFVRSSMVALTRGFSVCGSALHPMVILRADELRAEEDECIRRTECGEKAIK